MDRLAQKFSTPQGYLNELERISKRWVVARRGSYADLKDSGLLPRGL